MKNKSGKVNVLLALGVFAVIAILAFVVYNQYGNTQNNALGGTPSTGSTGNPSVNPAAVYATVDHFTSAVVTGAAYYKEAATVDGNGNIVGGKAATTTALANVNPGTSYAYWVSNSSTENVQPLVFTAGNLNNNVQNTQAWANQTVTLSSYDPSAHATTTSGASNTTLAIGANVQEQVLYQGIYQKSNLPFGGVLQIVMNTTITSVVCSGTGISAGLGSFHVTPSLIANQKAVFFHIDNTFDSGAAALQTINCQFQNGAIATANSQYTATLLAANYYVGNDGNIYLDTEKNMNNGDTTRTAPNRLAALTAYWA